ncbi:hypothetical protein BCV69DRAFT_102913 [Microstroma glucosiphilum]|uniref:Uncharacterized protein n=1 Tax=Pseudomicrostroma glucosiphilum TaxID=1684307 RepID=A0A316UEW9_9BASI|nr:hypothetical protein BCV69DRAFT_102913 [Pseudomicrostroma glucosiphilum]PWN22951.1 hypothetical protein BCV69DRAFT_102913 [Pseudomicrostroma glucosiphilum]
MCKVEIRTAATIPTPPSPSPTHPHPCYTRLTLPRVAVPGLDWLPRASPHPHYLAPRISFASRPPLRRSSPADQKRGQKIFEDSASKGDGMTKRARNGGGSRPSLCRGEQLRER